MSAGRIGLTRGFALAFAVWGLLLMHGLDPVVVTPPFGAHGLHGDGGVGDAGSCVPLLGAVAAVGAPALSVPAPAFLDVGLSGDVPPDSPRIASLCRWRI